METCIPLLGLVIGQLNYVKVLMWFTLEGFYCCYILYTMEEWSEFKGGLINRYPGGESGCVLRAIE